MKNLGIFRLRDATLAVALLSSVFHATHTIAQDGPGNKPESMAPTHAHMQPAKTKIASSAVTVTLGQQTLSLTLADMAALPHETVTVTNGHTKASETYSGVPVSALLAKLGFAFEKRNEHILLRTIFTAEGTDSYKVTLSVYETLAAIRGQSTLIADSLNGKPLTDDGAFKLVVPGDSRPQRWVQNLRALTFETVE